MRIIILSVICIAVIGIIVAVFLRFVKYFDKKYEDFEDERYRAAAGAATGRDEEPHGGADRAAAAGEEQTKKN
jgi:hypothetical protein